MITGDAEVDRILSRLNGQVQKELVAALARFSEGEGDRIRAAAARVGAQAALAARSINTARIAAGGSILAGGSELVTSRATGAQLFFGAEFGGGSKPTTRQFKPYLKTGYWFFPQLRADDVELERMIGAAVDKALAEV